MHSVNVEQKKKNVYDIYYLLPGGVDKHRLYAGYCPDDALYAFSKDAASRNCVCVLSVTLVRKDKVS